MIIILFYCLMFRKAAAHSALYLLLVIKDGSANLWLGDHPVDPFFVFKAGALREGTLK